VVVVEVVVVELVLDEVDEDEDEDDDWVLDEDVEELLFTWVTDVDIAGVVVDSECELVVEVGGGVELKARYDPTTATTTTTTIAEMTALLIAPRAP
jgi:hypothetical protein